MVTYCKTDTDTRSDTVDYDIEKTRTAERHSASAVVELRARETGEDDIIERERSYSARSGQTFTWRPTDLRLGWFWSWSDGEWVCDEAVLIGSRLKKDGTVGQRREERYLMNRWGRDKNWVEDVPAYARELEERFRPQSYVGATE